MDVNQLSKITDTIGFVGNLRLDMVVRFKNDKGFTFYNTYKYQVYQDTRYSIRRAFDYYLSISNMNYDSEKTELVFGPLELSKLNEALRVVRYEVDKTCLNGKYYMFYELPDNPHKLGLLKEVVGSHVVDMYKQGTIYIDPYIGTASEINYPAVKILLGSSNNMHIISVDRFIYMCSLCESLNLFQSAQIMVNSLNIPLGSNMKDLSRIGGSSYTKPTDAVPQSGTRINMMTKGNEVRRTKTTLNDL